MDNAAADNSFKDFLENLHRNDSPRNLRQIFEDDEKPLQKEASSSLRYQPHTHKQRQKSPQKPPLKSPHKPPLKPPPHHHYHHHHHHHQQQELQQQQRSAAGDGKAKTEVRWHTVIAKVAHAYNGSDNMGRVGVALMSNESGAAKLIVYKTKTQVLSMLLLPSAPSAQNVILRESYLQFYDDEQQFWSVRFDVAKDEEEFTRVMDRLGIHVQQMSGDKTKVSPEPHAQPRMRQQSVQTDENTNGDGGGGGDGGDGVANGDTDNDDDDGASVKDVIVTPCHPRPRSPNKALVALAATATTAMSTSTSIVLSKSAGDISRSVYIDDQRLSGNLIEKKMDCIIEAMNRLANSSGTISDGFDASNAVSVTAAADEPLRDNEDELLDLEQKLLNFKRQNRALIKSMQVKEQALAELRSSTCALCEELLLQNKELKDQNKALLAAMAEQIQVFAKCDASGGADKYAHHSRIATLERLVGALQSTLNNSLSNAHI